MSHSGKIELMSFIAGDLPDIRQKQIEEHLEHCHLCKAQLIELQNDRSVFLKDFPEINLEKKDVKIVPFSVFKSIYKPLSIAALLILTITGLIQYNFRHDTIRVKGSDQIRVFQKNDFGVSEIYTDATCNPGDLLQFSYTSAKRNYLLIASMDTTGTISTFFPEHSDSSLFIPSGVDVPLPNSIKLDNYLGPELYIAVFSAKPFKNASILDKIKNDFLTSHSLYKIKFENNNNLLFQTIMISKKVSLR